jgi:hypothetical protein
MGVPYCSATPTSVAVNGARLQADGSRCVGSNDLSLVCDGVVDGEFGVFFFGSAQINVPFGDGRRCVGGAIFRLWPPVVASGGEYTRVLDNATAPAAGLFVPGATLRFQCWFRDPAGGAAGFNLSNGMTLTFLP